MFVQNAQDQLLKIALVALMGTFSHNQIEISSNVMKIVLNALDQTNMIFYHVQMNISWHVYLLVKTLK